MRLAGLHHVTAVCSDARRTVRFYRDELGFRLVKKTVNFDDPGAYHLYSGDEVGGPGTLITFFEWPHAGRGRLGRGVVETIALTVPGEREVRRLDDPDGLRLELHPGERPGLHHVVAYGNPQLYAGLLAEEPPVRFAELPPETALVAAGVTHHVGRRARDDDEQLRWREYLIAQGLRVTEVLDRNSLGAALSLPDWREPERGRLEQVLTPL